jgi:hypothetical protein
VDLRAAPPGPRTPSARPAQPSPRPAAAVIDLASAPTRESAGFAAGTASRVWVNSGRAPFDVTVTLPGGRAYHARAELAVILGSTRTGDPDRLTIQLPPATLDATAQVISDYAAQWGFPADAVTHWHASAAQRTSGDLNYGTQVFTPPRSDPCTWSSKSLTMCPNAPSSSRPCFPGTPRPTDPRKARTQSPRITSQPSRSRAARRPATQRLPRPVTQRGRPSEGRQARRTSSWPPNRPGR